MFERRRGGRRDCEQRKIIRDIFDKNIFKVTIFSPKSHGDVSEIFYHINSLITVTNLIGTVGSSKKRKAGLRGIDMMNEKNCVGVVKRNLRRIVFVMSGLLFVFLFLVLLILYMVIGGICGLTEFVLRKLRD